MIELTIIIPCYNEAKNLENLKNRINYVLNKSNNIQFFIVNNGSYDNSREVFDKYFIHDRKIRVINVEKNKGYGFGIMHGLKMTNTKFVGWTHADLQTDISDILEGYKKICEDDKKIIKGKRNSRSFLDNVFTKSMSYFASFILNLKLSDINAQPKIFHRDLIMHLNDYPSNFCLDLYLLAKGLKSGYQINEINVFFNKRSHGESKGGGSLIGKIKLSLSTIKYIFNLKKNMHN